jgi:hypothetical protein
LRKLLIWSTCVGLLLSCDVKGKPLSRIGLPASILAIIKNHLIQIEQKGWGKLEPGELYHGHLMLKSKLDDRTHFDTVNDLFDDSAMMLYHSDEQLRQWRGLEGDIQVSKRIPRSIVGYWDGRILPAASLMKDPEKALDFVSAGTIHSDELATEMPDQLAFWRGREIGLLSEALCRVNLIVDINLVDDKRSPPNMFIGDRKFMVTMECAP